MVFLPAESQIPTGEAQEAMVLLPMLSQIPMEFQTTPMGLKPLLFLTLTAREETTELMQTEVSVTAEDQVGGGMASGLKMQLAALQLAACSQYPLTSCPNLQKVAS